MYPILKYIDIKIYTHLVGDVFSIPSDLQITVPCRSKGLSRSPSTLVTSLAKVDADPQM